MILKKALSVFCLSSLLLFSHQATFALDTGATCVIASNSFREASEIRGLKPLKEVPCEVHSKQKIEGFLKETISAKLPKNKLKMEEKSYKTLGLIPMDFQYVDGVIQLYLSQIGGYYDPDKKHFIMADWMPAAMQTTVAVHELTHALQDQYFNLNTIIDPKIENGDLLLARSALVEGDATAVMYDYARKLAGQGPLAQDESIGPTLLQQVLGAGLAVNSDSTPQSLKLMLLFPYTSGLRFTYSLLRQGGYGAIDKAFRRLPKSSEEILHPEKYLSGQTEFINFANEEALNNPFIKEKLGDGAQVVYRDTLGEFGISVLVGGGSLEKSRSADIAAGWGGDAFFIVESADQNKSMVVWLTSWDSTADAEEFWKGYVEVLAARGKSVTASSIKSSWQNLEKGYHVRGSINDTKVSFFFALD